MNYKTALAEQIDDMAVELDQCKEERTDFEVEREQLREESENLAEENSSFANYLEYHGYSQCEIDNIAQGWHGSVSDRLEDAEELKAEVKALRFRLRKIANYTVMEN